MTLDRESHLYGAVDGQNEELSELHRKVAHLEAMAARVDRLETETSNLRQTLRATFIDVASELRDDSGWTDPYWKKGADTMADHWWGKLSKRAMIFILGTAAAGLLLWLGSIGILGKK